jgi:hypothetical protein
MTTTKKQTYDFTLILEGIADLTDEVTDALYEAGCDDALVGIRDGAPFLDFTRQASSPREAILSAIADVESIDLPVRVVRVEPDELVTMAEIARRTNRTRENIRQLATGLRGPGRFPPPVGNLTKKSPIWRWSEVAQWLAAKVESGDESFASKEGTFASPMTPSSVVAAFNAALELRRSLPDSDDGVQLYKAILNTRRKPSKAKPR